MDSTIFIVTISYALFIASLIAIPMKRKNVLSEAGNCLLAFPKKRTGFIIGIDIVAVVLMTLVIFIKYSIVVTFVLCGCAVLGSWIIVGEAALGPSYGLYETGLIAIGKYIPYDDILTFPVLNLPKEEQMNYPSNVLVIASRKYGRLEIPFDSDEMCLQVVKILRKVCKK